MQRIEKYPQPGEPWCCNCHTYNPGHPEYKRGAEEAQRLADAGKKYVEWVKCPTCGGAATQTPKQED